MIDFFFALTFKGDEVMLVLQIGLFQYGVVYKYEKKKMSTGNDKSMPLK